MGVGYVAQTLINRRVFTVCFPQLRKRGVRAWLAMQLVGLAVTLAGDVRAEPGDTTEEAP